MTDERWQQIADLYQAAQDRSPDERSAFIREAAGDSDLRRDVESLLAEDGQSVVVDEPIHAAVHALFADNPGMQPGSSVGPYRIDSLLGVGGMGEVYRARDTKLNRDVAIKILPPAFANDPDRLARFKREAQVLASINHPNIAAIYGFEDSGGVPALVLELVEGPTLADRLSDVASGFSRTSPANPTKVGSHDGCGLVLEEALLIARQIADALEAAHEQGIIHRDLKPANIKVREDGTVKVLDFGLAKMAEGGGAGWAGEAGRAGGLNTQSPTITTPAMTAAGMILGTAAYMSPEQAKGKPADKRSDIWAFGCVVYEMLTGTRAFEGEDVGDTLANILKSEPIWAALPASTPAAVRRLLQRCLTKDARRRLRDIADARLELEEREIAQDTALTSTQQARPRWIGWIFVAAAIVASSAVTAEVFRWLSGAPNRDSELRVEVTTPATSDPFSLAVSPDGRQIVFAGNVDGRSQLWLRSFDSPQSRALPGTEDGAFPFWAPDNQSIAFFAAGKLKRLNIRSGSVQDVADARNGQGGDWPTDETILLAASTSGVITRVDIKTGQTTSVTRLEDGQQGHRFPQLLPDGQHLLYYSRGNPNIRGVYVSRIDGSESHRILDGESSAPVFLSAGRLFYVRQGTLFAQPFDASKLAPVGTPVAVADHIPVDPQYRVPLSVSPAGPIAYRGGGLGDQRQFIWFDRSGNELGKVGDTDNGRPLSPALSPDEKQIIAHRSVAGNVDIWAIDVARGARTRLTFGPENDIYPVWFPGGTRIAFSSLRKGVYDLYTKLPTADAAEDLLLASPQNKQACDISTDGRFLLYRSVSPTTDVDLWALPLTGDHTPIVVANTEFLEWHGQFSPDGNWVAYDSNESGRHEIYVQSFPRRTLKMPISTGGGAQARWSPNGRELFYVGLDERLMSVSIAERDGKLDAGTPVPLFPMRIGGAVQNSSGALYMVSRDGRFLMATTTGDAMSPIDVIFHASILSE